MSNLKDIRIQSLASVIWQSHNISKTYSFISPSLGHAIHTDVDEHLRVGLSLNLQLSRVVEHLEWTQPDGVYLDKEREG